MSDTPPVPPAPPVPPVPPAPEPAAVVPPVPPVAPPAPPVPPAAPPAAVPNPYAQSNPYAQPTPTPYGAPAYAAPAGYGYAPKTNTLAIVSLILAFFVSVAGVVCGHIALSQIKRTGEGGRGLALAGVIVGYVITGFWVLYFVAIIVIVVIGAASGSSTSSFN
jgi:hypothetical protein